MKFDIHKYKDNGYSMHCDTLEKAKVFCDYLDQLNMKWCSGSCYLENTYWAGSETCYFFNKGTYSPSLKRAAQEGTVLEFDDFEWEFIPKLESGMVVETKENKYLVVGDRLVSKTGWNPLDLYDDSLTNKRGRNIFDIQKIYKHTRGLYSIDAALDDNNLTLIWERKDNKGNLFHGQTLEYWHRVMWNWLADHPDKDKKDWGELQNFTKEEMKELNISYHCFACMTIRRFDRGSCCGCPICGTYDYSTGCLNGLYDEWLNSKGFKRAQIAHEIANLEWKNRG